MTVHSVRGGNPPFPFFGNVTEIRPFTTRQGAAASSLVGTGAEGQGRRASR